MNREIQRYIRGFAKKNYFWLLVVAYLILKLWTIEPSPITPIEPTIVMKYWTKKTNLPINQSTPEDEFQLIKEDFNATLEDGEALFETLFISIDKYTILSDEFSLAKQIGNVKTFSGEACSRIIKSRNKALPVDMIVVSNSGWRTHFKSSNHSGEIRPIFPTDTEKEVSPSIALNYLGKPGLSAYFAFEKIQPNMANVMVIGGADGAFGSVLGQLAKEKGYKVIGFASTNRRAQWLTNIAGFDFAFNYNSIDLKSTMSQAGTIRANIFFDHIGGEFFSTINRDYMEFGQMTICPIWASMKELPKCIRIQPNSSITQAHHKLFDMIKMDTLKYEELFTTGFDQIPRTLVDVLNGKNNGEAIVKI